MGSWFLIGVGMVCSSLALLPATGWSQAITYAKDIEPLFKARCTGCHGPASPLIGEFDNNKEKYAKVMKGPRNEPFLPPCLGGAAHSRHSRRESCG
jgi:hypothetical protein